MKIISFYREVSQYSVSDFFDTLNNLETEGVKDALLRINSPGGDVDAGWGWISGFVDFLDTHEGEIKCKVDGLAGSFAAYFLLFVESECLPQSRFVFHRASYPPWIEETEERQKELKKVNKFLKEAFIKGVDVEKFEKISGVTVDRMFDEKQDVIDVELDAKQAKAIKLVKKIVPLSPIEASTIKSLLISAHSGNIDLEVEETIDQNEKVKKMDINEFKEKHPEVYASAVKRGVTQGDTAASDRINAWMKFFDFDAEAVKAGIESGKEITMADISEFYASQLKDGVLKASVAGNAGETDGKEKPLDKDEKTPGEKDVAAFNSEVDELLKLK